MSINKSIVISSISKAINKAKITGDLDINKIYDYYIIQYYIDYLEGNTLYVAQRKILQQMEKSVRNANPNIICNFKTILPVTQTTGTSAVTPPTVTNLSVSNFTVTSITEETLFGIAPVFATYRFKKSDFLSTYTDNNDGKFHSLVIFRNDLQDGGLRYRTSPTTGNVFGQSVIPLEILYDDIEKWAFYTDSTSIYIHQLSFKVIDRVGGTDYSSNTATLTVDRTAGNTGNQPATFGDFTTVIDNRTVLTITLAMVTSTLTPPYNDPEGDLIDAIRLPEISTANKGVFKLNGVAVQENDIITREQLDNEEFTYEAPEYDDVWGDSFRFQGRDEGSGIWVD